MNRVAASICAGLLVSSGCSDQPDAANCEARFSNLVQNFPPVTSRLDASYVFDGGERVKDADFLKSAKSVEGAIGDPRSTIASFEKRDFDEGPSVLLTQGVSLIGIGRTVDGAADAVRQGCALEARYGTLRNVRLTSLNPTFSTKNQQ